MLADPRVLAWHREAFPSLAAAGLSRLYVFRRANETFYNFRLGSKLEIAVLEYEPGGFYIWHIDIGQGPRSIPHRVNNEMRHYVHPRDWTTPTQHDATAYAPGSPPPA